MSAGIIRIVGACQNNLKNLSLDFPLNELIVISGVSGSGKSSLAFDTLYAEGQRRYVESFSAYARQFLERMDKPQVERVHLDPCTRGGKAPLKACRLATPMRRRPCWFRTFCTSRVTAWATTTPTAP